MVFSENEIKTQIKWKISEKTEKKLIAKKETKNKDSDCLLSVDIESLKNQKVLKLSKSEMEVKWRELLTIGQLFFDFLAKMH